MTLMYLLCFWPFDKFSFYIQVSLASDFMYNYMSRDVTASFGYDYILRQVISVCVIASFMQSPLFSCLYSVLSTLHVRCSVCVWWFNEV